MVQQIRRHGSDDHMPSGSDPLPWLGDYPFPGGASANQGIHMAGTAANRPTASLGTQTGADGAVSGTAFTAASGHFISADTGDTIQIVDTGAATPVVYSFTVTYVSATALTLSSSWVGVGTSSLSWALMGPGPSNAGLLYATTDTDVLYLGTGSSWLEIADFGGGGGSGFQFNSGTYGADNVGDWSLIEATDFVGQTFSQPNGTPNNDEESSSLAFNAANGVLFTQAVPYAGLGGVVSIEQLITAGSLGASCLLIDAQDTTASGSGSVQGLNVTALAKSSADLFAAVFSGTQESVGGSGDAYGLQASGANSASGREIGGLFQTGGFQTGANSLALLCENSTGTPIFEVRNDGSVHIKTGTSVIADL